MTNPLVPIYQELGRTQRNLRQDVVYAESWKEQPIKKTGTRTKPEWRKSTVIPSTEEKKVETNTFHERESALAKDPNVYC